MILLWICIPVDQCSIIYCHGDTKWSIHASNSWHTMKWKWT